MNRIKYIFFALVLSSVQCFAAEQPLFFGDKPPATVYPVNQMLYKSEYTIGFSYHYKEPLYTSEYITPSEMASAEPLSRSFSYFAEDTALPEEYRVSQNVYKNQNVDKGHDACSADMPDLQSQHETYVTSNIVPQPHWHNNGVWKHIEENTRKIGADHKETYVITGNIFMDDDKTISKNGVTLHEPHYMYKAVATPDNKNYCIYLSDTQDKDAVLKLYDASTFARDYSRHPIPMAENLGFTCTSNEFMIDSLEAIK